VQRVRVSLQGGAVSLLAAGKEVVTDRAHHICPCRFEAYQPEALLLPTHKALFCLAYTYIV
jgi:hypothetical protein